jgi:hypothetical protein
MTDRSRSESAPGSQCSGAGLEEQSTSSTTSDEMGSSACGFVQRWRPVDGIDKGLEGGGAGRCSGGFSKHVQAGGAVLSEMLSSKHRGTVGRMSPLADFFRQWSIWRCLVARESAVKSTESCWMMGKVAEMEVTARKLEAPGLL